MRKRLITNPKYRFRMQIVSLLCALIGIGISAAPFWGQGSEALLLILVFSSLAAGGLLRELVAEAREKA